MRFNIPDLYVNAIGQQGMGFLEHPVGFAYSGAHPDIDLEFSPPRLLNQAEKMLYTIFLFIFH
jgi:hypothetical protein